ncbi:hypothetical protein [Candidatus Magnetomonas plexicatena]|uniref:hypothetical protein n=1 Tax=Candidatus Magnetomonas plexicatena TaxID=2552947 RepID=UPI001C758B97|nr:hypothetical protein E2O03_011115 [Nitrospirales bacterium LBB_01]
MVVTEAKEAVKIAANYFKETVDTISRNPSKISIEEIEFDDGENCWLITLGILIPKPREVGMLPSLGKGNNIVYSDKEYKVFKIDPATGNVKSMKVRKI